MRTNSKVWLLFMVLVLVTAQAPVAWGETIGTDVEIQLGGSAGDPGAALIAAGTGSDNVISGTLSLPVGVPALTSDLTVRVNAWANDDVGADADTQVTIPAGQTEVPYSLEVSAGSAYTVSYRFSSGQGFCAQGYYSGSGTVPGQSWSQTVDSGTTGVNLSLLPGRLVQGTVSLPDGQQAPDGGIMVRVDLYYTQGGSNGSTFVIGAGENSVSYSRWIAIDVDYHIGYCLDDSSLGYVGRAYLGNQGMVYQESAAMGIGTGTETVTADLTLLPAARIIGSVTLPEAAPDGGLQLEIKADSWDGELHYRSSLLVLEGETGTQYVLPVQPGQTYRVSYSLQSAGPFIDKAYWSAGGMVSDYGSAGALAVQSGTTTADLQVLSGAVISGRVHLPGSDVAPAGGIVVRVLARAADKSSSCSFSVNIPEDSSWGDFTLSVAPGEYRVSYTTDALYCQGYYRVDGTTPFHNRADMVSSGSSSLEMTLIPGRLVSGTLSLPDGMVAPAGGIAGSIFFEADDGWRIGPWFTMPDGTDFASYSYLIDASASYKIGYQLDRSIAGCAATAYCGEAGQMVTDKADAWWLEAGTDSVNLNLAVLPLSTGAITGSISLPVGRVAPNGGLDVSVTAQPYSGGPSVAYDSVHISEGASSTDFTLNVSSGSDYRICYYVDALYCQGYYAQAGTTPAYSRAQPVSAGTNDLTLTLLPGRLVSGTVYLPGNAVAPAGGIEGGVDLNTELGFGLVERFFIPENAHSATYSFWVDASYSYWTAYSLWQDYPGYSDWGCLSQDGSMQLSSWNKQLFAAGESELAVDLTLIPMVTLSGTVSLPEGEQAPPGGLKVHLAAKSENGTVGWVEPVIPEGESSVSYELSVGRGSDFRVSASLVADQGYVQLCYFSLTGTTTDATEAEWLPGNQNANANLTLIPGASVSGTVRLPVDAVAPGSGLVVVIEALPANGGVLSTKVQILAGGTAANYSLCLDPHASYFVRYYLENSQGQYLPLGYYAGAETTADKSQAVSVSPPRANVELTLLPGDSSAPSMTGCSNLVNRGVLMHFTKELGGDPSAMQISWSSDGITYTDSGVQTVQVVGRSLVVILNQPWTAGGVYLKVAAESIRDLNGNSQTQDLIINPLGQAAIGDLDLDGETSLDELSRVAFAYGLDKRAAGFDYTLDLNLDGQIDLFDLVLLARNIAGGSTN